MVKTFSIVTRSRALVLIKFSLSKYSNIIINEIIECKLLLVATMCGGPNNI